MTREFFGGTIALAAALNCFLGLSLSLVPRPVATQNRGPAPHVSGLSGEDRDAGHLHRGHAPKSIVRRAATSLLVEEDDRRWREKVEGEQERHGSRRRTRLRESASTSGRRGRLSGGSIIRKRTGTASKILVASTLAVVAVLMLWHVGNVFMKCLARARALKQARLAGLSPRSLSEPNSRGANFDYVCGSYDLDPFLDADDIVLIETSDGVTDGGGDGGHLRARPGHPRSGDAVGEGLGDAPNGRDVVSSSPGNALRKTERNRILEFAIPVVVLTIFAVLVFVTRPSRSLSRLAGKQTFGPIHGETAAPSPDPNTSAFSARARSVLPSTAPVTASSTLATATASSSAPSSAAPSPSAPSSSPSPSAAEPTPTPFNTPSPSAKPSSPSSTAAFSLSSLSPLSKPAPSTAFSFAASRSSPPAPTHSTPSSTASALESSAGIASLSSAETPSHASSTAKLPSKSAPPRIASSD